MDHVFLLSSLPWFKTFICMYQALIFTKYNQIIWLFLCIVYLGNELFLWDTDECCEINSGCNFMIKKMRGTEPKLKGYKSTCNRCPFVSLCAGSVEAERFREVHHHRLQRHPGRGAGGAVSLRALQMSEQEAVRPPAPGRERGHE